MSKRTRNLQSSHARSVPHALVIVPPRPGDPVARIEIPRLHLSVMVLEGTTPKTLRVAAGPVTGTALPGTTGNVGIAAHRDTFFRPLRDVRVNDGIVLTTPYGAFRYVVEGVEIVDPTDVQVLAADDSSGIDSRYLLSVQLSRAGAKTIHYSCATTKRALADRGRTSRRISRREPLRRVSPPAQTAHRLQDRYLSITRCPCRWRLAYHSSGNRKRLGGRSRAVIGEQFEFGDIRRTTWRAGRDNRRFILRGCQTQKITSKSTVNRRWRSPKKSPLAGSAVFGWVASGLK